MQCGGSRIVQRGLQSIDGAGGHGCQPITLGNILSRKSAWNYRSGTVNSKSFVGKDFLRIKWKCELTVYFKYEIIGK